MTDYLAVYQALKRIKRELYFIRQSMDEYDDRTNLFDHEPHFFFDEVEPPLQRFHNYIEEQCDMRGINPYGKNH